MGEGKSGRRLRLHRSVFLALVVLALLLGAAKFWGPFSTGRRQQEELAELRRQKAELSAENKELTRYKELLASDQGLESAARREGYVRSGDRRIIFVPKGGKPGKREGEGESTKP